MGIPGLSTFLRQRYPQAFLQLDKSPAPWPSAHIYFDLNYILHFCSGRLELSGPALTEEDVAKFADAVIEGMNWYLSTLLDAGISASSVTVCIDGPPSVRKFQEQRDRRRSRIGKKGDEEVGAEDLIGLALTPGTEFMESLAGLLLGKLREQLGNGKITCPVSFADSNAPGEGEHKIAAAILESERSAGASRHIIIGGDADLIVIAMAMSGGTPGELCVFSEDLFIASRLCRALGLLAPAGGLGLAAQGAVAGRRPFLGGYAFARPPAPRGSIGACVEEDPVATFDGTTYRATIADFSFLSLLGGNDYLAAAVKRPKKGGKSHMEWLLEQYRSVRTPFMAATKGTGPNGLPVWDFRIVQPEILVRVLSGGEALPKPCLSEQDKENCEEFLMGVLWALATFANGCVPSSLTTCDAKASSWTLIDYFRAEPARAKALHVEYPSTIEGPLSPLTVAACVLPWRAPVLNLLGDIGAEVLELAQGEFPDVFEYEAAQDAKQLQWIREKKWVEGPYRAAPEALALRGLEAFDAKVRAAAEAAGLEHKVVFSELISVEADDAALVTACDIVDEGAPEGDAPGDDELEQNASEGQPPPAKRLRVSPPAPRRPCPGDAVEVYWPEDSAWLPAKFVELCPDGLSKVRWEDGAESAAPEDYLRLPGLSLEQGGRVSIGADVEVLWPEDDSWLLAVLAEVCPDGSCQVTWAQDGSMSNVPSSYLRELST